MKTSKVTVPVTFKDGVRKVKFVATKTQVKVTCKGRPKIVVHPCGNKFEAYSPDFWSIASFSARTPEKAYIKAVKAFWL